MANRIRLCPEITDPELRVFLDMASQVRRYQREIILAQPLSGEGLTLSLPGRDIHVCLYRASGRNRPVVFEMHGGGFVFGLAEKDDALCAAIRNQINCHVVAIDYRLTPETPYPGALNDVCDTIRYFADHAEAYDMDASRMAVLGFSSGANLAAAAAIRAARTQEFSLKAQVLHYPYLDSSRMPAEKAHFDCDMDSAVMKAFTRLYSTEEERKLPEVSPVYASSDDLRDVVPALLLLAERDALKEEGLIYAEHLEQAGVSVAYKVIHGVHHGYVEDAYNKAVYEAMTGAETKASHNPFFCAWANAAVNMTNEFLKQRLCGSNV